MEFSVQGGVIDGASKDSAAMRKLRAFLDNSEDGAMWTAYDMAIAIGYVSCNSVKVSPNSFLEYRCRDVVFTDGEGRTRRCSLWGSKKTIKAYKEHLYGKE